MSNITPKQAQAYIDGGGCKPFDLMPDRPPLDRPTLNYVWDILRRFNMISKGKNADERSREAERDRIMRIVQGEADREAERAASVAPASLSDRVRAADAEIDRRAAERIERDVAALSVHTKAAAEDRANAAICASQTDRDALLRRAEHSDAMAQQAAERITTPASAEEAMAQAAEASMDAITEIIDEDAGKDNIARAAEHFADDFRQLVEERMREMQIPADAIIESIGCRPTLNLRNGPNTLGVVSFVHHPPATSPASLADVIDNDRDGLDPADWPDLRGG